MLLYLQRSRLVNSVNSVDWRNMLPEEFNTSRGYKKFNMDNLARFVLRARIVQEHSLSQDIKILEKLTRVDYRLALRKNIVTGEEYLGFDDINVPHTEQIESGAARVRPVFLLSDGIFYADVLAFLYEKITDANKRGEILALLHECQSADPDYPDSGRKKRAENEELGMSNKAMAGSWLYGSLIHDDENRRTFSDAVGIEHVYLAAVRTVARMMLSVIGILHFMEPLVCESKLDLDPNLWLEDVMFEGTILSFPGELTIYRGEPGMIPPKNLEADMVEAEGWKPIYKSFIAR